MYNRANLLFLWQHKLLGSDIRFSDGKSYNILDTGMRIEGSAIDFTHAMLSDKDNLAVISGSIRIDAKSSDWSVGDRLANGSGVMLHVVFECDEQLFINGNPVLSCVVTPCEQIVDMYTMAHKNCVAWFSNMDDVHRETIIERLAIERLNRKAEHFTTLASGRDWAEAAYVGFMGCMGYGNRAMFEKIALSLPLHYLEHHFAREQIVEALLLGQAGVLNNIVEPDEYTQDLMHEFIKAKTQNSLLPPPIAFTNHVRGHSSPAISLVRAAHILCQSDNLLDSILKAKNCDELRNLFNIALPSYWCDNISPSHPTRLRGLDGMSASKIDLLIINFVAPLIVGYGRAHNLDSYPHKAIDLLEQIKSENNRYTRKFEGGGYQCRSAYTSQAIIELGSVYCSSPSCTSCPLLRALLVDECGGNGA